MTLLYNQSETPTFVNKNEKKQKHISSVGSGFCIGSVSVAAFADTTDDGVEMTPAPTVNVVGNQVEVEISDDDEHTVTIYALTGSIVRTERVTNGKTVIDLSRGYYIVKVDKTAKRVIIR